MGRKSAFVQRRRDIVWPPASHRAAQRIHAVFVRLRDIFYSSLRSTSTPSPRSIFPRSYAQKSQIEFAPRKGWSPALVFKSIRQDAQKKPSPPPNNLGRKTRSRPLSTVSYTTSLAITDSRGDRRKAAPSFSAKDHFYFRPCRPPQPSRYTPSHSSHWRRYGTCLQKRSQPG